VSPTLAALETAAVSVTRRRRGFTIVDLDGTVSVDLAGDHFRVSGSGTEYMVSLYAYRGLVAATADRLIANWRPRGERPPRWLRRWKLEKTRRIFGKQIHTEWMRLLEEVDPTILAVQRALFAATFDQGASPLPDEVYADECIVHDIVTYRAAAVVAARLRPLTATLRREHLERISRRIQESEGLRLLAEEHGVAVEMLRVAPAGGPTSLRPLRSLMAAPTSRFRLFLLRAPARLPIPMSLSSGTGAEHCP
jgi:hypothetical protein